MADERVGARDQDVRKKLTWTELLKTFLIALDPFKLLIAAVGILLTAFGWWLISLIYFNMWSEPKGYGDTERDREARTVEIKSREDDLVKSGVSKDDANARATAAYQREFDRYTLMRRLAGPSGSYRTMPWFEDRGRNPFLLARGAVSEGTGERRSAISWLVNNQVPVLIEPLLKFLSPIFGLFDPAANFWVQIYLLAVIVWMLAIWAFFGGVITRMAIVQMAGKEGGGLRESLTFVRTRYLSYLSSPLVPILLIFAVVLGCIVFGLFFLIPLLGDIVVAGLFWWIIVGAGFVMALLVVGLVGYPLMYTTVSAEGSDTFDALSRSYNYVYESPWSYIWYSFVAVLYGAVVVFFVVFMTSLMVYLGKWGVSQTPLTQTVNRSPEYLFIYSPTSFGWRELMLQGSPVEIAYDPLRASLEKENYPVKGYYYVKPESAHEYMKEFLWYNHVGAGMVGFWLTLLFLLMLGFSYSYFWTAASMIYLLMRKKVDEVEIDEIYTEEADFEEPVAPKISTPAVPPPSSGPTSIPIDAPTLRVSPPAAPPPPPAAEKPPEPPAASPDDQPSEPPAR